MTTTPSNDDLALADELRLLVNEYDTSNSDWRFRKGVILGLIDRLAAAPPAGGPVACEHCDFFDMLWGWFEERRGSEDMRACQADGGLSADDFKNMLDEHEANLLPDESATPQAQEPAPLTADLTQDFAQALPGGKLDDSTYEKIETALDQVDAPCTDASGKWLSLHERITALSSTHPQEPACREALEKIIKANDEFRASLPSGWEGDPLSDACNEARAILTLPQDGAAQREPVAWRYKCKDGSEVLMLKRLTAEQKRRGYYTGEDGEDEVEGDEAIVGPLHWAEETPLYSALSVSVTAGREITDEMVNAGARELWNDRDARMGGSWDERDPREVCVIQTKATMRAALNAALSRTQAHE